MSTTALNLEISTKLHSLQEALLESHPTLPTLLRDIHTTLKQQPEQVTLMSEEELNIIVQGLEKQTNSYIAQAVTKKTTSKRTALKASIDDLF